MSVPHFDIMDAEYDALAQELVALKDSPKQTWVCIAGGPGSGKSTLTAELVARVNKLAGSDCCICLSMDGFHYSRSQLREIAKHSQQSSKPVTFEDLLRRRGAPWTFDAPALVSLLKEARSTGSCNFPVYSRQKSDPVPNGVTLEADLHRIVLVEGNYLLNYDDDGGDDGEENVWRQLEPLFDIKWFVQCENMSIQRRRLIARHLETWTEEKVKMFGVGEVGAAAKADSNDVVNAEFVANHAKFADKIIISLGGPTFS